METRKLVKYNLTPEMKEVFKAIDNKEHVFVTGKAGTGKTTFLKVLEARYKGKCVIVAPTGVAAVNAGGVTIHSMFGLPTTIISPYQRIGRSLPPANQKILEKIELLIIDEISMVRADIMDAISTRMKQVKKNRKPFGGVQVVMFGDLMQLPPISKSEEMGILSEIYGVHKKYFFFLSKVFLEDCSFKTVQLTKIFRQKDEKFISILNGVRDGFLDLDQMNVLNSLVSPIDNNCVKLTALKKSAQDINEANLKKINGKISQFEVECEGTADIAKCPCESLLLLKPNARVMITKNDNQDHQYYNGSIGRIKTISNDCISVELEENKNVVLINKNEWEVYSYKASNDSGTVVIDKKVVGKYTQFPLILAWAITIHKSQGLTFDKVYIDNYRIFEEGQLYTALSRCRSLEGVKLSSKVNTNSIRSNEEVSYFLSNIERNDGYFKPDGENTDESDDTSSNDTDDFDGFFDA